MKTFDFKSLVIGILLGTIIVVFTMVVASDSAPRSWEYRVVQGHMGSVIENAINAAAKDGWEVVGVATDTNVGPFTVMRRAKMPTHKPWWKFWQKG